MKKSIATAQKAQKRGENWYVLTPEAEEKLKMEKLLAALYRESDLFPDVIH